MSNPQSAIGPNFGDSPNSGIKNSVSITSILPSLFIVTFSNFSFPSIFVISAGVISRILFLFFRSLTFSTESKAPLNSFLLWINVTLAFILARYIVQSKAESPPPAIITFLFL